MAEYSRMAKGSFTATGTTQVVPLPFVPDYVELWNYSIIKTAAANKVARAWWDNKLVDGSNNPTMVEIYNNSSAVVFDTIQTNGISTYSAGLSFQFGPQLSIVSITQSATAPLVTTTNVHNLAVGDVVIFMGLYQSATTGMPQMSGIPFAVKTVPSTTTFTIGWNNNGSNYTALTGSPSGAYVKKVLNPFLYEPGVSDIAFITTGTTTTIVTSAPHCLYEGQEVAFRIPSAWGTIELNSLPNFALPGSPVYGYVQSVTDSLTVVVNINSSSYTAFNPNIPFANTGIAPAQMVAVGDLNTGGVAFSGGALYPSPFFPTPSTAAQSKNSINGAAVKGAFVNNTSQGFIIGSGAAAADVSAAVTLIANTNIVYWHAYLHDYAAP